MKAIFTFCIAIFSMAVFSQSIGDTIVVPSFNYSQTPAGNAIRDTMIDFPDDSELSFSKIIMLYNMRCKDGNVSVPGNTNYGCGEWDYSCNTYITDSSRVDSVLSFTNSHVISNFSGDIFYFLANPMVNYYQYLQHDVEITNIISETQSTVGTGTLSLNHVLQTDELSGKSQYLYLSGELSATGVSAGEIDGMLLTALAGTDDADFLRVKIKETNSTELDIANPDNNGFSEAYFNNSSILTGENRLQFYTPFVWDGSSNLIIEISTTNEVAGSPVTIEGEDTGNNYGLYNSNDNYFIFNAFNYIEADDYKGISGDDDRTCEAWIKTSVANKEIISWGINNASQKWVFRVNDDGTIRVEVNGGNIWGSTDVTDNEWHHVACVFSGTDVSEVLLYVDGQLETIGGGTAYAVNTNTEDGINIRISKGVNARYFDGIIDEVRVWESALTQQELQDWMYKTLDSNHPNYNNLAIYYPLNDGGSSIINDVSGNSRNAAAINGDIWGSTNGNDYFKNFSSTSERPNVTFLQGDYNLNIVENTVTQSLDIVPNTLIEYEIIPRWGTMLSDSLNELANTLVWEEGYEYTFDPQGTITDSLLIVATDTAEITELTYYKRYPAKYEILSLVSPYGIYLDLGMEGKTWAFDVTDYTPILKGTKQMTMARGGQKQEDLDIKFLFIVGTPPQDIIDINQIWRPDYVSYTNIIDNDYFEPRDFYFNPLGNSFKFRSVITGHGQQGEFTPRHHTLNINEGEIEYDWTVWTECSNIAIYPQGGTWIYDRAGWCPGTPSDIYEYDISEYVVAGQSHILDYGIVYASGTSNYIVNNQLVTYGEPNFLLDAAVTSIIKPNNEEVSQDRFNPACSYPEIIIQNTGLTTLTSLDIEYFVEGGVTKNYTWSGSLNFLQKDTIVLPIEATTFWLGSEDKFTVNISNPNEGEDEYNYNNTYTSKFDEIYVFPDGNVYTVKLKTNNYGWQTSYKLSDGSGNIMFERSDCDDNTIYEDEFHLFPGCYNLRIDDLGDNGLEFWHQPNQGVGYFKILNSEGETLYTFEPDFGGFATFEFGIGNITNIGTVKSPIILNVYPNPTSSKLVVNIMGLENGKIAISLTNTMAAQVIKKDLVIDGNEFSTEINMEHLPSGIYLLNVNYGNYSKTERIIKY